MSATTMNVQLRQVIKTTSQWNTWQESNSTTVIPAGVLCVEIDTNSKSWVKVGDGTTAGYKALPYVTDGAIASLGQFMQFKGILATLPTTAATGTYKVGDVLLIGTAGDTPTTNDYTEYVCTAVTTGDPNDTLTWEELGPIGMEVKPYVGGDGISITDGTGANAGKKVVNFVNGSSLTVDSTTNAVDIANSVTAGTASGTGAAPEATPTATNFGGTINLPSVTYDAHGLITEKSTTSFALPDELFTESGVTKGLVAAPTTTSVAATGQVLRGDGWAALTSATGITLDTSTTANTTQIKLDAAGASTLGGVSVAANSGLSLDSGAIAVKTGAGLSKDSTDGTISVAIASDSAVGGVKTASTSAVTVNNSTGVIDVDNFSGPVSNTDGKKGLVPAPAVADDGKLLTTGGWTALTSAIAFDGTYDATNNKAATVSTVTNAINALDVPSTGTGAIEGFGAGKTLATLTETDGIIDATFQDISITASQISNKDTTLVQSIKVNNSAAVTSITGGEIDLTGIATSVTVNGGTAVTPGNDGTVALTGIVTGATLNGSNVTVTNGVAALGGLAKTITYTASGTPGASGATTGTINVSSTGDFDLSELILQCTL